MRPTRAGGGRGAGRAPRSVSVAHARPTRPAAAPPLLPPPPNFCRNQHHYCQLECLEGFSMCKFHILEDRTAPFRPCCFTYANGNKCGSPVPRKESQSQCEEHRRRRLQTRERAERAPAPPESLETLTEQLRQSSGGPSGGGGGGPASLQRGAQTTADAGDPSWEEARRTLARADSDSESESERVLSSALELSSDDGLSGASDDDMEPLTNAGVYTDEEVIRMAEQRLTRLQRLYMGQFQHLRHELAARRRAYLLQVAREKETMCSVSAAPRLSAAERRAYQQLAAFQHHQKPAGKDYLFWHQRNERRARRAGRAPRQHAYTRCAHLDERQRCGLRTVPLSRFCLKHILQDRHQVLFAACGDGGDGCPTPVPAGRTDARCRLHVQLPTPGAVRMPEDPMEAVLGLTSSAAVLHAPLDETQSRLVATIANTLMASGPGAIDGAGDVCIDGATVGVLRPAETGCEVDVTGDVDADADAPAGQARVEAPGAATAVGGSAAPAEGIGAGGEDWAPSAGPVGDERPPALSELKQDGAADRSERMA